MTRLDGRTYILDDDARHSAFCVANQYPYRHGFGPHSFALHLRLLYGGSVDPLTVLRVARWLYPDGCDPAHDRVVRRLDKREQQSLWLVRRLWPDADPAAILAHHDEVRRAKRARIAQLTGGDGSSFDDSPDQTWADLAEEVRELLPAEDVELGSRGTYNAFYTPEDVASSMWGILLDLRFTGGRYWSPAAAGACSCRPRPLTCPAG